MDYTPTCRRRKKTVETRFWAKVAKREPHECWEWTSTKQAHGYGVFQTYNGIHRDRVLRAHRLSYELNVGPIPEGAWVLHSCDNPGCVNPSHLRTGTPADNTADMMERGRNGCGSVGGEDHHASKLTRATVDAMRREYAAGGITYAQLGAKYGVAKPTAREAVIGKTWR